MIEAAILDYFFVALFNVVKEVSLKSIKNKTWDLTSRTFRSNDAEPTNSKN